MALRPITLRFAPLGLRFATTTTTTTTPKSASKGKPIVIGKSIGSLCFALQYLKATGQPVEIVNVASPKYTEHDCVILPINAMKVFRQLGVDEEIVANGSKIHKTIFRDGSSKESVYGALTYPEVAKQYDDIPTIGIQTRKVVDILQTRALKQGIPVRQNKSISHMKSENGEVVCTFRGGVFPPSSHNVAIICDGEGSKIHEEHFGPLKRENDPRKNFSIERYNFVMPIPEQMSDDTNVLLRGNGVFMEWFPVGNNTMFGSVVLESVYGRFLKSGHQVRADEMAEKTQKVLFGSTARGIVETLTKDRNQFVTVYFPKEHVPEKWNKDAIISIGESCYTIVPGSHQEAAMEAEDGFLLANSLARLGDGNAAAVLESFSKQRYSRINGINKTAKSHMQNTLYVREMSYRLNEFYKAFRHGTWVERRRLTAILKDAVPS